MDIVKDIKNIAVIGAGMMGPGISLVFAEKGLNVILFDLCKEILPQAVNSVRTSLSQMAENGIMAKEDIEPTILRVKTAESLEYAIKDADLVIEAVTEKLELKQNLFRQMDSMCGPDVILATNTSVISITEIASRSKNRSRILGTHFWNPPHLIPLVEVIKASDTSNHVMDRTVNLLTYVGKKPVRVKKDVPGFLANRLQHALWREAISIVENGIADAAEVDEAIKNSFGLRLPVLGPLENADLVGLDLTLAIHDYVLNNIEDSHYSSSLLKQKVESGELGIKTGKGFQEWSDERTADLKQGLVDHLMKWAREH